MKIKIEHYKNIEGLSKPQLTHESWLEVGEIEGIKEHDMIGSSGWAVVGEERLPVSKLYLRGHTWTTCVNDNTGERWA